MARHDRRYYFHLLSRLLNRLDERAQEHSEKEAQLANLQQDVAQLEEDTERTCPIDPRTSPWAAHPWRSLSPKTTPGAREESPGETTGAR